jgi:type II secretory pathway component GspD/PulD (secretin)
MTRSAGKNRISDPHTLTGLLARICVAVAVFSFNVIGAFAQNDASIAASLNDASESAEVVATGSNLRLTTKRLTSYDIPGLKNKVLELKSVEPFPVILLIDYLAEIAELKNIVMGSGLEGLNMNMRFEDVEVGDALEVVFSVHKLAYEVQGGIISVMTDEAYREKHGVSFYDNKQVRIVELAYADATRVAGMLGSIKSDIGTVVADPLTGTLILVDTPEKILEMRAVVKNADIKTIERQLPTETQTIRLQYASVDDIEPQVQAVLTPEVGKLHADVRTRTMIVTDLPHKMEQILRLVALFDEAPKQVFIEAKILEVTLSDEYKLGINWTAVFDGIDPRYRLDSEVRRPILGVDNPGIGSFGYQTIISQAGQLNAVVEALESVGETKILQNPHVAVLDGEEATVRVVQDLPYAETSAEITGSDTNFVGEDIVFLEVGVSLTVTPHITDDGHIRMELLPEISSGSYDYQAFRQIPVVSKTFTETVVNIKDGESIIIAGMIENGKRNVEQSVPLFGRIPLLGLLFKSTTEETSTREVVVFVTPRIMKGDKPMLRLRDSKKRPKPLRVTSDGKSSASSTKKFKPIR